MSMKIAMLLDNPFRPDLRVLREAKALAEAGHEVTIFAWDRDKEVERPIREKRYEINIIRIPIKTGQQLGLMQIPKYWAYIWRAFRLVMQENYQVIHCHDLLNLPIGIMIKWLKRIPLVYDAHEIYWIMEFKKYPSLVRNILKAGEIFLLHWVDILITVGKTRLEYYRQYTDKPIYLVGNWYDCREIDRQAGIEFRKNLGIPLDAFVVTYAGTLSTVRASDVLVETVQLMGDDSSVHWIICGRGEYEQKFIEASRQLPYLHFLGWVEDIESCFSASNAMIYLMDKSHPYSNYNSPNNLYLSIAWALPLIGINAGEIGAVLESGKTGMLVDCVEADTIKAVISRLSKQPDLYDQLAINLKVLQDTFSWQTAKESLFTAYQRLASRTVSRQLK